MDVQSAYFSFFQKLCPTDLVWLILNPHSFAHPQMESRPVWALCFNRFKLPPLSHVPESSANWLVTIPVPSNTAGRSLIKREKSRGDSIAPWGVPLVKVSSSERELPTLTCILRPSRKFLRYWKQFPVIPCSFNLYSTPVCQDRSKAAWRSRKIASTDWPLFLAKFMSCCNLNNWSKVLLTQNRKHLELYTSKRIDLLTNFTFPPANQILVCKTLYIVNKLTNQQRSSISCSACIFANSLLLLFFRVFNEIVWLNSEL